MVPQQKVRADSAVKGFNFEKLSILILLFGVLLMSTGCNIEKIDSSKNENVSGVLSEGGTLEKVLPVSASASSYNVKPDTAEKAANAELSKEISDALASGEGPHVIKLKNGMSLLIKEDDRFPLVNVRLFVHAGSSYEEPAQAGISHLLEHMVFKGTKTRGPGETAREIESVGGDMNAATSF